MCEDPLYVIMKRNMWCQACSYAHVCFLVFICCIFVISAVIKKPMNLLHYLGLEVLSSKSHTVTACVNAYRH